MANRVNSSGSLRMSTFFDVFGTPSGKNLGAYRVSDSIGTLTSLPLDIGIPQSGTIRFSDFYGKRVNVVVDYYSISNFVTRRTGRNRFNTNNYTIVGRFRSTISTGNGNSSGARVILNLNRVIGSDKGNIGKVALRTGTWQSDTLLELEIGTSGGLIGAGGDGGAASGNPGKNGTSALGLEYPTTINNRGYIQGGMGGGGGGGTGVGFGCGRSQRGCDECSDRSAAGAGGGGGAGFPNGSGVGGGQNGTLSVGGNGGIGQSIGENGTCSARAKGGDGGKGGSTPNTAAQAGQNGGDKSGAAGGAGGATGYSIIMNNGATYSLRPGSNALGGSSPTSSVTIQ